MKIIISTIIPIIILLFSSCDGGLSPRPESDKTFLNGKIKFVKGIENWPPEDSVIAIRAAAFKQMPDSNIINSILQGDAYFTGESLPLFVDSSGFRFEIINPPVELVYITIVWQYTDDIMSQRVVGVYSKSGNKNEHSSLILEKGQSYDIVIEVDFDDLPPMPF
ncbi:MAG: hypothetical protein RBT61_03720 [Candidatus Kapabacteria bacterium]|jgi:hypothetical protein|nr:hypothetical protein [Candidatus Kapabacteria bacterium]